MWRLWFLGWKLVYYGHTYREICKTIECGLCELKASYLENLNTHITTCEIYECNSCWVRVITIHDMKKHVLEKDKGTSVFSFNMEVILSLLRVSFCFSLIIFLPYTKHLRLFSLFQVYQSDGEIANNCSLYMLCSTSNKVGTKVKVMDSSYKWKTREQKWIVKQSTDKMWLLP